MPGAIGRLDLFWFSCFNSELCGFLYGFLNCTKMCVFFLVKVEALQCLILIDTHEFG